MVKGRCCSVPSFLFMQPGWREIKASGARPSGLSPWHTDGVTARLGPSCFRQGGDENLWAPQDHNRCCLVLAAEQEPRPQCKHFICSACCPCSAFEQLPLLSLYVLFHVRAGQRVWAKALVPGFPELLHCGEALDTDQGRSQIHQQPGCQGLRLPLKPHSEALKTLWVGRLYHAQNKVKPKALTLR